MEEILKKDANRALQQIVRKDYRDLEGLLDFRTLREYSIAGYHLSSCVKGRYLELNTETDEWVEQDEVCALSEGCRTESRTESSRKPTTRLCPTPIRARNARQMGLAQKAGLGSDRGLFNCIRRLYTT